METQIFHHSQKIDLIFKKKSFKRNQNPSRHIITLYITNLKFQHKPKISSFKNPLIKKIRPIIIIIIIIIIT